MYSPRPPSPFRSSSPASPSSSHPASFASVTDPTLHRHGWRSPRAASDEPRAASLRSIPNRYRSLLRYDALLASPLLVQSSCLSPSRPVSSRAGRDFLASSSSSRAGAAAHGSSRPQGQTESYTKMDGDSDHKLTNLDELEWFQHRWLGKHGKNSHLKETREKMALLRRWFESLDADGSGEVGVDELEDPLVSVGLARSRDEVQKLIEQVDKNRKGEVNFTEFLRMMNPQKPKRVHSQRIPLHTAKPHHYTVLSDATEEETKMVTSPRKGKTSQRPNTAQHSNTHKPPASVRKPASFSARGASPSTGASSNPVVKLFEDLQSGKLGDLAIPFPVLITAYRRRMLLNAHMAEDATARRLGSSVLQALESTRRDGNNTQQPQKSNNSSLTTGHRRRSSVKSAGAATSYLHRYVATAEAAAAEVGSSHTAVSVKSDSGPEDATHLPSL